MRLFLSTMLFLLHTVSETWAQSDNGVPDDIGDEWLSEWAQYSWDQLSHITSTDPDVPRGVSMRIITDSIYPLGYYDPRRREVVSSTVLTLFYVYFSDIDQVSFVTGVNYEACKLDYQIFLARQMIENQMLIDQGDRPNTYWPPEEYGNLGNSCTGLRSSLPLPGRFRDMRDQRVVYGMWFIYLHELGHAWHRHRAIRIPDGRVDDALAELVNERLCQSRLQEYQADNYAVDVFAKYEEFNAVEISPFFDVVGIDIFTLLSDRAAYANLLTHPAGGERKFRAQMRMFGHVRAAGVDYPKEYAEELERRGELYEELDRVLAQLWESFSWRIPNPEDCRP